jgi:hypothetical protein
VAIYWWWVIHSRRKYHPKEKNYYLSYNNKPRLPMWLRRLLLGYNNNNLSYNKMKNIVMGYTLVLASACRRIIDMRPEIIKVIFAFFSISLLLFGGNLLIMSYSQSNVPSQGQELFEKCA